MSEKIAFRVAGTAASTALLHDRINAFIWDVAISQSGKSPEEFITELLTTSEGTFDLFALIPMSLAFFTAVAIAATPGYLVGRGIDKARV